MTSQIASVRGLAERHNTAHVSQVHSTSVTSECRERERQRVSVAIIVGVELDRRAELNRVNRKLQGRGKI